MHPDFLPAAKKAISSLKTISEILNAIPINELHNRPPIVLNDGCTLSVQGKGSFNGCSCYPSTPVGPWENLEVGYPDREIAKLMPFIEGGIDPVYTPDEGVYHHVPSEVLDAIIKDGGGVAGYLYDGEVVPVGQIRGGLMWLVGTYGNPTGKSAKYGWSIEWTDGDQWSLTAPLGTESYATKEEAIQALAVYKGLLLPQELLQAADPGGLAGNM